jgi:arabinose-5-phosphate isomerase
MHRGDRLPVVKSGSLMSDALVEMSAKGFGCVLVVDHTDTLLGIITDGDLRRHMAGDLLGRLVEDVMTRAPRSIAPSVLVAEALEIVETHKIGALIVTEQQKPVGLLHVLDLLRAGAA